MMDKKISEARRYAALVRWNRVERPLKKRVCLYWPEVLTEKLKARCPVRMSISEFTASILEKVL